MSDLFDFGAEMPPLDDGPGGEVKYDDFNDDTFGDGAEVGDWQQAHEKLAQDFGDLKPLNLDDDDDFGFKGGTEGGGCIDDSGFDSAQKSRKHEDDLEKSMTQFVLDDDDDDFFDPAIMSSSKQISKPISIGGGGSGDSNMSQLFGPSSPPSLFDPTEFMSPSRTNNIWGSPSMTTHRPPPRGPPPSGPPPPDKPAASTEKQLKAMLNIGAGGDSQAPLEDAAIVKAVHKPVQKKVFTLEELERDLTSRAPPRRMKSPILGSPPPTDNLPIGTPPRHHFMQKAAPGVGQSSGQGSPIQGSPLQYGYGSIMHNASPMQGSPLQQGIMPPSGALHNRQQHTARPMSPIQGSPLQQGVPISATHVTQQQARPVSPLQGSPLQQGVPMGSPHTRQQQARSMSPIQQGVVMPGGATPQQGANQREKGNGAPSARQGNGTMPGMPGSPMPGRSVSPNQQLPAQVVQSLTQQIHKSLNGRVSPSIITQLILHMHNTSGRVSPNQICQKVMMAAQPPPPPQLSSSPAKPHPQEPRMIHPRMPPPGSPMMQFSPGGPGRMPHPHNPPPGMHRPHPMGGRPPPMGYMYGLTPMNPRIPPLHARSDPGPGPRGRFPPGRYPPPNNYNQQYRGYSENRRPFNRRYDNQRHDNRGGSRDDYYNRRDNREPRDEYSNLMNQREKDWVIKIQMLQLQTSNPYLDDYYYTTYLQRKSAREKGESKDGSVRSEDKDDKDNKGILPQQKQFESRSYQPAQFAGALGRLTSSSVNNPRQIIDVHINAGNDEEDSKAKDHSRRRKVLLSIERVYTLLLEVDDLEKQVLSLPESDRGLQAEKKQALVAQMYGLLKVDGLHSERSSCDHFVQVLSIRKGRKLLSRIIPYMDKEQAVTVVKAILQNLSFLLKREMQDLKKESPEETLSQLYRPIANVIKTMDLSELTCVVNGLISRQPGVSPNRKTGSSTVVASAVQTKFGLSVVLSVLNQGEVIFVNTSLVDMEQDVQFQWIECVNQMASDICVVSDTSLSQPLKYTKYDSVLAHFARFVSKQSYNALDKRLRPITMTSSR